MKAISNYKALARTTMQGSYGMGVAVFFGVTMAQSILSGIFTRLMGDSQVLYIAYNILSLIISIILINPLMVGVSKFFLEQSHGRPDMKNVFYSFNTNLTNTVKVCLIREVKLMLWMLIPAVIGMCAIWGAASYMSMQDIRGDLAELYILWLMPIVLVLMIPGIIKSIEYSVINYILAENPDMKSKEVFKMARTMMQGNKRRLFLLELSFIGWLLLGVMAFGIGIFFVIPYMEASVAHFYMDLKAQMGYIEPGENVGYNSNNFDDGDTFGI